MNCDVDVPSAGTVKPIDVFSFKLLKKMSVLAHSTIEELVI